MWYNLGDGKRVDEVRKGETMGTNKMLVINQCFLVSVSYVSMYSPFLADNLNKIWVNYKKASVKSQKSKYFKQFNECIKQVLSKKNFDEKKFREYMILEINQKYKKYGKYILNYISNKGFRDVEIFFIREYDNIQKNMVKVELPKINKKSMKVIKNEKEYSYVTYNNEIYCHMSKISVYPFKRFNKKSFFKENERFTKSLREKKDTIYTDLTKEELKNLNTKEKLRRIYVKDMFLLMLEIKKMEEKRLDITYPIEEYFKMAKLIADKLYLEVIEDEQMDKLRILTIQTYGPSVCLELYDKLEKKFINNINVIDKIIKEEYIDTSRKLLIENKYVEFNFIRGIIPRREDILKYLNNKIIDTVPLNYKKYMKMMNKLEITLGKYMDINEYIKFYTEMKYIILSNSLNNKNVTKDLVIIQKAFSKILGRKMGVKEEQVIENFFKEDVII